MCTQAQCHSASLLSTGLTTISNLQNGKLSTSVFSACDVSQLSLGSFLVIGPVVKNPPGPGWRWPILAILFSFSDHEPP